ncbi:mRNA turnover protein 4 [Catenaria anguillulae PL171]|uniref:Ribosome assembly factor mrt4 n=1 Tax=Catenaria anguillulae PL171 TaxID=765915 RepID=A0A1Y2HPK4_9FUNG|nr:mRNA turnover protein 4 [Catenaria anguillulae PL171]
MPKSKRQRVVHLTQTSKVGRPAKSALVDKVRAACDAYSSIYVFSVTNMRNSSLKTLRDEFADDSRFLMGKVKVLAKALGEDAAEEYLDSLHLLTQRVKGQVGLLFTNRDNKAMVEHFKKYSVPDYARAGNVATETIFPHNMEPQLRKLGLPTKLDKGVVTLLREYTVCEQGKVLNADQAQLLKLFYHQQAHFRLFFLAYYDKAAAKVHDLTAEFPQAVDAAENGGIVNGNASDDDEDVDTMDE